MGRGIKYRARKVGFETEEGAANIDLGDRTIASLQNEMEKEEAAMPIEDEISLYNFDTESIQVKEIRIEVLQQWMYDRHIQSTYWLE